MNRKDHHEITNLCLEDKITHSKKIIKKALARFERDEIYIAWTGGKDSTTMVWLYLQSCRESGVALPRAMFIDEGHVFEEILELVNKVKTEWGIEVEFVKNTDVSDKAEHLGAQVKVATLNERNRREIKHLKFEEEAFPFEPESFVGNHLMKTVAMNVFIENHNVKALSTAIRWDEQEARIEEDFFSSRTEPEHLRIHPILHFTERDIWNTIHNHNIPFCALYCEGYRSLGAKGSTVKVSDVPAWEQDLENTPERSGRGHEKEAVMSKLRSLGYM